jgi:hypothetical protein
MELGGFIDYSKWSILEKIAAEYLPKGKLFKQSNISEVHKWINSSNIKFPLIFKPDRGERGFQVEKIDNKLQMNNYLKKIDRDFIVQEYIDFPLEFGVMYSRIPSEEKGAIHSVVHKEFLTVTGDGKSTLQELFQKGRRTKYHYDLIVDMYNDQLDLVLNANEKKELVSIGNHCRGTTFLDATHLINDQLLNTFDKIALPIDGFYFGRFDLRVPSIEDLYNGTNIRIMELNGVNSEPAHMYDPDMPLLKAYQIMFNHWALIYKISRINHENGVPYASFGETYKRVITHLRNK